MLFFQWKETVKDADFGGEQPAQQQQQQAQEQHQDHGRDGGQGLCCQWWPRQWGKYLYFIRWVVDTFSRSFCKGQADKLNYRSDTSKKG